MPSVKQCQRTGTPHMKHKKKANFEKDGTIETCECIENSETTGAHDKYLKKKKRKRDEVTCEETTFINGERKKKKKIKVEDDCEETIFSNGEKKKKIKKIKVDDDCEENTFSNTERKKKKKKIKVDNNCEEKTFCTGERKHKNIKANVEENAFGNRKRRKEAENDSIIKQDQIVGPELQFQDEKKRRKGTKEKDKEHETLSEIKEVCIDDEANKNRKEAESKIVSRLKKRKKERKIKARESSLNEIEVSLPDSIQSESETIPTDLFKANNDNGKGNDKKTKKKKKHSKEQCDDTGVESETLYGVGNSHEKRESKKKKHKGKSKKRKESLGSDKEDVQNDGEAHEGNLSERSKKKKSHPKNVELKSPDDLIVTADKECDGLENKQCDLPVVEGQWKGNLFENSDRQNKFLRLLGGMKNTQKLPEGKKNLFSSKNESKTKGLFGSLGNSNIALSFTAAASLDRRLEQEYDRALDWRVGGKRGSGLGFTPDPAEGKSFHIDINKTNSTRFDA